jgi:hypothetical protein
MKTTKEETKDNWMHGNLNGLWEPTADDMIHIYSPWELDDEIPHIAMEFLTAHFYSQRKMSLPMLSTPSLRYNLPHRIECFQKMLDMPWDDALLSAYHNFQFACYMAAIVPSFYDMRLRIGNSRYMCQPGLLGREIFILKMLYETASEIIGPTFRNSKEECRISTLYSNDGSGDIGLCFHIVGTCVVNIVVKFEPRRNLETRTYSCLYRVDIDAETWKGDPLPLAGKRSPNSAYIKLLKDLKVAIKGKLNAFKLKLQNADFNQPGNMPDDMR